MVGDRGIACQVDSHFELERIHPEAFAGLYGLGSDCGGFAPAEQRRTGNPLREPTEQPIARLPESAAVRVEDCEFDRTPRGRVRRSEPDSVQQLVEPTWVRVHDLDREDVADSAEHRRHRLATGIPRLWTRLPVAGELAVDRDRDEKMFVLGHGPVAGDDRFLARQREGGQLNAGHPHSGINAVPSPPSTVSVCPVM